MARIWWTTIILLIIAVILVAFGVFDPHVTPVFYIDQIDQISDPIPTSFSVQATFPPPHSPTGVVLTGHNGLDDVEWGVAADPSGFVHVWRDDIEIMPWQPWPLASLDPYIKPGEPIVFWIDVTADRLLIRINREIVWSGSHAIKRWHTIRSTIDK